jgi:hypothetical protein
VASVAPQHGDRDIAVLYEAAAMQPAAKSAETAATAGADLGFLPFRLRPMVPRGIAQQTQCLAHLRFSFIDTVDIIWRPGSIVGIERALIDSKL